MQNQPDNTTPPFRWLLLDATSVIIAVGALTLSVLLSLHFTPAHRQTALPTSTTAPTIHLTIIAPMTMADNTTMGPMYIPTTTLTAPAHTLVTMTIINQDLGDTPLPPNSPYSTVTGVTNDTAQVDGMPYTQLDTTKVAHTFTIPELGVNVPIPGDSATGQSSLTVTFTFITGSAGTFVWRCMDPCGTGPSGWAGPMAMPGQMMGTLTVG